MKKYYFTFGQAHTNNNRYQVIFAKDVEAAYAKMFDIHGKEWAFGYTLEEWTDIKADGFFSNLKPLENAYTFLTYLDVA
ncbi:hypothetical protein [Sporosarcina sp. 6E9]|uniref:hypothetical protein n=1 Tax=Sporosarcina sp. 6E9 TaxID=2819235 RepID=UPI001AC074A0|nr:hypothetical protein [Sporosarcina sp. 6E9]MBO1909721.1 hypothetical protein [Microvirga sp. 3-52]